MEMDGLLGLLGLLLGAAGGGFGWWYGRKKAAENRGLDERYEMISLKSQANSWKVTLVSFYVLFVIAIFGVHFSVAMILSILILIHLAGWAFWTFYFNLKL